MFIAGNIPMVTEITPLLIITKLQQYDYAGATAVAFVLMTISFHAAADHQCACRAGASGGWQLTTHG